MARYRLEGNKRPGLRAISPWRLYRARRAGENTIRLDEIMARPSRPYDIIGIADKTVTAVFTPLDGPVAVTAVTIEAPTEAWTTQAVTLTASALPLTATLPITYTWEATGQESIIHSGGISDTIAYTWAITGTKTITVTVENEVGGPVTTTHTVAVVRPLLHYLPVVLKE